jgi:putative sigma-54 modulation protein
MKISIKAAHFNPDMRLKSFIENKLGKLTRFNKKIENMEVTLKLQETGVKIKEKIIEIHITGPGVHLFEKKSGKRFETATNQLLLSLKEKLGRTKENHSTDFTNRLT